MNAIAAVAGRDLRATFSTPFGFGLVSGYLALSGVLLVIALRAGEARLDGWFAPLFVITALLCALLTMRSFAEEERMGSLELLLAAPIRPLQVVLGKLLGALGVLFVIVVATLSAPIVVAVLGNPDFGPVVTGYLGLALLCVAAASLGLVASAASSSQLAAAAVSSGALLGLWFGSSVANALPGVLGGLLGYLSPSTHVSGFLRGTIAVTDVVYFASFASVAVAMATVVVRARR